MRATRLLVIHADNDSLDITSRWFGRRGFMVTACDTSSEAVTTAEQIQVALDVVRQLRELDPLLPIVVLAGSPQDGEAPSYRGAGTPTSLSELEAAVRRALGNGMQSRRPTS